MTKSVELIHAKHDGLVYEVIATFTYKGGSVKIVDLVVSNKMLEKVDKRMFFHALNIFRACINDEGHHQKAAAIITARLLEREANRMFNINLRKFLINVAVMMLLATIFIGSQALP